MLKFVAAISGLLCATQALAFDQYIATTPDTGDRYLFAAFDTDLGDPDYFDNFVITAQLVADPVPYLTLNPATLYIGSNKLTDLLDDKQDVATAFDGTWSSLTGKPSTFTPSAHTHAASDITSGTKTSAFISDFTSSARGAISVTGNGSYNSGTGVITINSPAAHSFNYTTRSLNTCFQPSSTRDALVTYSVDIATTLSLTTGQTGTVYLEIFSDSGCTTGTQEITRFVNGNTGSLTIGLNITQNVTGTLTGVIPAGSYVKLRTQNNTGTPTFTARPGQETLL